MPAMAQKRFQVSTEEQRVRSCTQLAVFLGIHKTREPRTMESARQEIQEFFDEHGCRPKCRELENLNGWLRYHHRITVSQLCDEMGLPGEARTMESVRQQIQEFYGKHGRRPFPKDLPRVADWLRTRDSSLRQMCNEIGFDGGPQLNRTMESARQEIQEFFDEHGRRPTTVAKGALNAWLTSHGCSLHELADRMGLPGPIGPRSRRTMKSARRELQAFFDEHGRRPSKTELKGLRRWLEKRKLGIGRLGDQLGLPDSRHTMEGIRKEFQEFFDEHGRRPMTKEFVTTDRWLRRPDQASSLHQLCDEMGFPGGVITITRDRTMESVRKELQEFFDEHGRPPLDRERPSLHGFLRRHESTVRRLCEEMGFMEGPQPLSKLRTMEGPQPLSKLRTMEGARQEIQEFFDEHGHRPTCRALENLNRWLRTQHLSVTQLCHEMGLPRGWGSMKRARQQIQEFFDEHGRSPLDSDIIGLGKFLRQHGCTVWSLCEELGLRDGRRPAAQRRTMESARQEIQEFFDEHGRRPREREMRGLCSFLSGQRETLRRLCDEMGLPGGQRPKLTMESARQEIQKFFDEHSRRPGDSDLKHVANFLPQLERKTTLRKVCKEMGLPGGNNWDRTMEEACGEIRDFFNKHDRRPRAKELSKLNGWLHCRGSSVHRLCNEMALK